MRCKLTCLTNYIVIVCQNCPSIIGVYWNNSRATISRRYGISFCTTNFGSNIWYSWFRLNSYCCDKIIYFAQIKWCNKYRRYSIRCGLRSICWIYQSTCYTILHRSCCTSCQSTSNSWKQPTILCSCRYRTHCTSIKCFATTYNTKLINRSNFRMYNHAYFKASTNTVSSRWRNSIHNRLIS